MYPFFVYFLVDDHHLYSLTPEKGNEFNPRAGAFPAKRLARELLYSWVFLVTDNGASLPHREQLVGRAGALWCGSSRSNPTPTNGGSL